jgi:glycerol uptake facilitator-like aquaporin/protein-tyrosine-phosphatase
MRSSLARRVVAEGIGTALLLATVIGSGIMGERLAGGNVAIALLANTLATGAGLVALILTFGGISGAHFNPAVTVADASQGGLARRDVLPYVAAQVAGAFAGVALAHVMFGLPVFSASQHARAGVGPLVGELTATFGLVSVIRGCARARPAMTPFAVAAFITAAYWFTSSTSFANPAVTLARAASDTFAGIRPADAPGFIAAQFLGAAAATLLFRWLAPNEEKRVLFLCIHNSARSQMAAAFLKQIAGDRFDVESAGLEPGTLNPLAVAAMGDAGIDISRNGTQSVFDLFASGRRFDYVISVCDAASAERCPIFPGAATRLNWSFADPSAFTGTEQERLTRTIAVRDEIRAKVQEWVGEESRP